MRAQRDDLARNITYLEGALEDVDYVTTIFGGVQNNPHPDMPGFYPKKDEPAG